jgi:hypothetical protein
MMRWRRWLHHQYRLRLDDDRLIFRAEPDSLDEDDLNDLAQLRAAGWDLTIETGVYCPFPSTVVVRIEQNGTDDE